jgi:hypothetical protein
MIKTLVSCFASACFYSASLYLFVAGSFAASVAMILAGAVFMIVALHNMNRSNTLWRRSLHEKGKEAVGVR